MGQCPFSHVYTHISIHRLVTVGLLNGGFIPHSCLINFPFSDTPSSQVRPRNRGALAISQVLLDGKQILRSPVGLTPQCRCHCCSCGVSAATSKDTGVLIYNTITINHPCSSISSVVISLLRAHHGIISKTFMCEDTWPSACDPFHSSSAVLFPHYI